MMGFFFQLSIIFELFFQMQNKRHGIFDKQTARFLTSQIAAHLMLIYNFCHFKAKFTRTSSLLFVIEAGHFLN